MWLITHKDREFDGVWSDFGFVSTNDKLVVRVNESYYDLQQLPIAHPPKKILLHGTTIFLLDVRGHLSTFKIDGTPPTLINFQVLLKNVLDFYIENPRFIVTVHKNDIKSTEFSIQEDKLTLANKSTTMKGESEIPLKPLCDAIVGFADRCYVRCLEKEFVNITNFKRGNKVPFGSLVNVMNKTKPRCFMFDAWEFLVCLDECGILNVLDEEGTSIWTQPSVQRVWSFCQEFDMVHFLILDDDNQYSTWNPKTKSSTPVALQPLNLLCNYNRLFICDDGVIVELSFEGETLKATPVSPQPPPHLRPNVEYYQNVCQQRPILLSGKPRKSPQMK